MAVRVGRGRRKQTVHNGVAVCDNRRCLICLPPLQNFLPRPESARQLLAVGLAVPFLAAGIGPCWCLGYRRRRTGQNTQLVTNGDAGALT